MGADLQTILDKKRLVSEQTFFNEGHVQVTRTRVVIGNRTYPVNGITSIRTADIPPNVMKAFMLGLLGVVIIIAARGTAEAIVLGLIMIGVAVYLFMNAKSTHSIFFGTAGGEQEALSSFDSAYVNRVASAINDALTARG
jgi:Family of unknown function (DUF6232)